MIRDLEFIEPNKLMEQAESEMDAVPNNELFNNPKFHKLTEKWCAAKFGIGYEMFVEPCYIALNDTNQRMDADFFLKRKNEVWPFQLAEVQFPGRKRGLIYKKIASGELPTEPYEPERGHSEGPTWIANAIKKKCEKNYQNSDTLNLLVYVNFTARHMQYEDIQKACEPYKNAFSAIWLLTYDLISTVFGNEKQGMVKGWGVVIGSP